MRNIGEVFRSLQGELENRRPQFIAKQEFPVREVLTTRGISLFLAIEPVEQKRMVIIPVSKPGGVNLKQFPACQGSKVQKDRFDKIGRFNDQGCLIIRQTSSETTIFESFAANLCERLDLCDESELLPVVRQTLQKWQNFFRKVGEEGLSAEERRGLFAELSVLRTLLDQGCQPDIVSYWKGPFREKVDFRFGPIGLEVKSTTMHRPLTVTIASEEQLSSASASPLFLVVLPLQVSQHDGETLLELINDLRERLQEWPLSRQEFDDLLIHAGFLEIHAEAYRLERFRSLERCYFQVEGSFPRIEPAALPPSVVHVQYQIVLDGCSSFRREEAAVIGVIQGAIASGS